MTNLIEKAIENKKNRTKPNREVFSPDEVQLALAWVDGLVGVSDITKALGKNQASGMYIFLARALKQYLNNLPKQ